MRGLVVAIVLSVCAVPAWAQKNCQLQLDKDSIKVYTCDPVHGKTKMVEVTFTLNATFDQVEAMLMDVPNLGEWQYQTISAKLLRQISKQEIIYYTAVKIPVVNNRDFVIKLSITRPTANEMRIMAVSLPAYIPPANGFVRVQMSEAAWVIRQIQPGKLSVFYTVEADVGGALPAWLINALAHKAPYETFKKMREIIHRYR